MKRVAWSLLFALLPAVASAQPFETLPGSQEGARLERLADAPSGREQAWAEGLGARATRVRLPRQALGGGLRALLGSDRRATVEAEGLLASGSNVRALRLRFRSGAAALAWALHDARLVRPDGTWRLVEVRGAQAIALEGPALADPERAWRAWRAAWDVLPGEAATTLFAVTHAGAVRAVGEGDFAAAARSALEQLQARPGRARVSAAGEGAVWAAGPGAGWVAFLAASQASAELSLGRRRAGAAVADVVAVDTLFEALAAGALVGGPLVTRAGAAEPSVGVIGRLELSLGGEAPAAGDDDARRAAARAALPARPDLARARERAAHLDARRRAFLREAPASAPTLRASDLVLAGVRDALAERLRSGRTPSGTRAPLVGTDRAYAERALATIDAARVAPEVPWPMVEDLTLAGDAIARAPGGEIQGNVRDALSRLQAARLSAPTAPTPRIDLPLGAPEGEGPTLGRLDVGAAGEPTPGPRLEIGTLPTLPLPARAGAGPRLPEVGADGPSVALRGPQQALLAILEHAPHGAEPGVGEVIDGYARAMNAVEGALPPVLPFALTLPRPLAFGEPGGRFVIPAGAVLRQRGGAYEIAAPGMLLETPGSLVVIDQGSIRLGDGLDQLRLGELEFDNGSRRVLGEAVEAAVDRRTGSAWVLADRAVIDTRGEDGGLANRVELEGVRLVRTPGTLLLAAEHLDSRSPTSALSARDLELRHDVVGERSTVLSSVRDLDAELDGTRLSAARVDLELVREGTGEAAHDRGRFVAEDLDLDAPGVARLVGVDAELHQDDLGNFRIAANGAAATFHLGPDARLELAAGGEARVEEGPSGLTIQAAAGDVELLLGDERHHLTGATLDLRRGPDGALEALSTVDAADLGLGAGRTARVSEGQARLLQSAEGDLWIDAAASGAVIDLGAGDALELGGGARARLTQTADGLTLVGEAGEVSARLGGRSLDASEVALDLRQGPDGSLSAAASATRAAFTLADGRQLRVSDGAGTFRQAANGDLWIDAAASGAVIDLGAGDALELGGGARARLTHTASGLTVAGEAGRVTARLGERRLDASGVALELRQGADGSLAAAGRASEGALTLGDGRAVRVREGAATLLQDADGNLWIDAAASGALVSLGEGDALRLGGGARARLERTAGGLVIAGQAGTVEALVGGRRLDASDVALELRQGADGSLLAAARAAEGTLTLADGRGLRVRDGAATLLQDADGNVWIDAAAAGAVIDLGAGDALELGGGARARLERTAAGLLVTGEAGTVAARLGERRLDASDVALELRQGADGSLEASGRAARAAVTLADGRVVRVSEGAATLLQDAEGNLWIEAAARGAEVSLGGRDTVRLGQGARARLSETAAGLALIGEAGEVEALIGGRRLAASDVTLDVRRGPDGSLAIASTVSSGAVELERGAVAITEGSGRLVRDAAGHLFVEATAEAAELSLAGGARLHLGEGARATLIERGAGLIVSGEAGRVTLISGGRALDASDAALLLEYGEDGGLAVRAGASRARLEFGAGRVAEVVEGDARLVAGADGDLLVEASASGAVIDLGEGGLLTLSGGASASLARTADGLALAGRGGEVDLLLGGRRYQATDAVLDLTQREDGSLALRGEAASARIPLDGERSAALTRGVVRIDQAADGSARLVALTEAAEVTLGSGAVLTLSEGAELDLTAAADGSTTLTTRVGRAALALAEGDHLELAGLSSTVRLDGDDRLLSARLHSGVYTRAGTRLELVDASLEARHDGERADLDVTAAFARYGAADASGQWNELELVDPRLAFGQGPEGSTLDFSSAGGGRLNVQGHTIAISGLPEGTRWEASLQAGPDGLLEEATLELPGTVELLERDGRLALTVSDLSAEVREGGDAVRVAFGEAGAVLEAAGVTATARDGLLSLDERAVALHVGEAEVLRQIGDRLGLEGRITGVDLHLARGESGGLRALDLGITELDFEHHVEGLSVHLTSADGTQTRLGLRANEAGELIEEAFLEIPAGGELRLAREGEFDFTLGEQALRLAREENGAYRVRAEGLDVAGRWRDVEVRADSELIDVRLDPEQGLVFDDVTATHLAVRMDGREVELDIAELDRVMLRMTGYEGATRGAAIRLAPTGDGSRISLEVRATVDGLPVRLELDDLAELEALATVRENEARVLLHDPTGRGTVELEAGPVSMRGSGVGFRAAYNPYSTDLFLNDMGRLLSREGVELNRGVSVEPDGVVRVGLPREWPVRVDLALGLPTDPGSESGAGSAPTLAGTLEAGGERTRARLTAGLSGASSFVLDQTHGTTHVFGVRAPSRFSLPTTAFASVGFSRTTERQRLDLEAGVFANPAAFAPADLPLREDVQGGAFAGLRLVRKLENGGSMTLGVNATAERRFDGSWNPGARLTLSIPLGGRR